MKRGFTLIELLAVLVILAIISLIAVPIVLNIVENTRKSAAERSAEGIIKSAKTYYMENEMNETTIENPIDLIGSTLDYDGKKPDKGKISFDNNGNVSLNMYLNGYCVTKKYNEGIKSVKTTSEDCEIIVPVT